MTPGGRARGVRRLVGTVRFRVTALATLVVLVLLGLSAVGLVLAQRRALIDSLDATLDQRADDVAALVATDQATGSLGGRSGDDTLAQVVDGRGRVIAASPNLTGGEPVAQPPPPEQTEVLRTQHDLPIDDDAFRVLSRRVDAAGGDVVVHVAGTLDDAGESTATLATSLVVAVPAVAAVLALLVWWLVGRTLEPVEAIRTQVAGMSGRDLGRRVSEPAGDDEIARLARTMNGMLDRVEDAVRRQQRFVADASHELRSPLARMRSELEVDLAHPAGADREATEGSVLEETIGLQHLVDDLLLLARGDAGAVTTRQEAVDLDDIVLRQAARLRDDGRAGVAVDVTGVTAAQVRGDARQLDRLVANLVDNAVRHARSAVTVTLAEDHDHARLTVADDGPGIPPGRREQVFERFTRIDDARSAGAGGTGLGLAIARDIARRHGGTIAIAPDHDPGACFVVTLPRSG